MENYDSTLLITSVWFANTKGPRIKLPLSPDGGCASALFENDSVIQHNRPEQQITKLTATDWKNIELAKDVLRNECIPGIRDRSKF